MSKVFVDFLKILQYKPYLAWEGGVVNLTTPPQSFFPITQKVGSSNFLSFLTNRT